MVTWNFLARNKFPIKTSVDNVFKLEVGSQDRKKKIYLGKSR